MRVVVVVALAVGCVMAGVARGAATPLTPAPGSTVTTSHPLFSWTAPATEESDGVYVAIDPATTPEGRFYDENVVDAGIVFNDEHQWSPTSPLYAGTYWWLVWSHDRSSFQNYFSAPATFSIRPSLNLLPLKTRRFPGLHWLDIDVRWRANTRAVTVRVQLLRRGRTIWKSGVNESNLIGSLGITNFTWQRPRKIPQGARLTLRATLLSKSATARRAIVVRAP
jgi:hypothetical protein